MTTRKKKPARPEFRLRPVDDLEPMEHNPRSITEPAFKRLCDSLRRNPDYFEARPIILSDRQATGKLRIIAGNQRYLAAKAIGLRNVPTVLIRGLTKKREQEIAIRDNVQNGKWDKQILREAWSEAPLADWGLDLPDGWMDHKELAKRIASETEYQEAKATAADIASAITAKLREAAKNDPERFNRAIAIVVQSGRGNDVLILADPATSDIVKELQRYADSGERSPLDRLIRETLRK